MQNCTGEEWKQVPRSRTEACHAFPEGNLVIKQTQIFSLAMFLLCACCSDEQIEGGWGGGEAAAEHLMASAMVHLHDQLRTSVSKLKSMNWDLHVISLHVPFAKTSCSTTEPAHTHTPCSPYFMLVA